MAKYSFLKKKKKINKAPEGSKRVFMYRAPFLKKDVTTQLMLYDVFPGAQGEKCGLILLGR